MASLTDEPLNPKRTNFDSNASGLGLSRNRPKDAGDILKHHYCETCKIWAPPLSVHCETCNHCVKDFAGHNFMVSNDIGLRNNKHYIYLCLNLAIVFGIWFLEGVWTLSLISAEGSFDEISEDSIGLWYSGIAAMGVVYLLTIVFPFTKLARNPVYWILIFFTLYANFRSVSFQNDWWMWAQPVVYNCFLSLTFGTVLLIST
jgi:hypothetical protein